MKPTITAQRKSRDRASRLKRATTKLLETMVPNAYLLPVLLGRSLAPYDVWHGSNWAQPDYASQGLAEFKPQLSPGEQSWISDQLASFRFRRVLKEYVSTYGALKTERDGEKRRLILDRWRALVAREVGRDG